MRYIVLFIILGLLGLAKASDNYNWINLSSQTKKIEKFLHDRLYLTAEFDDFVIFKFFPTPHFSMMYFKVSYEDNLMIDSSKVSLYIPIKYIFNTIINGDGIMSFLRSNETIDISDIFINADIIRKYMHDNVSTINNLTWLDFNINLIKGNIINFKFKSLINTDEFIIENTKLKIGNNPNIWVTGDIKNLFGKKFNYGVKILNIGKEKDIDFFITDMNSTLNFSLDSFNYENLTLKSGIIDLSIDNLEKYLKDLEDFNAQNLIVKKSRDVKKSIPHSIKFKSDIISTPDGTISLNNPTFQGNLVQDSSLAMKFYRISSDIFESKISFSTKLLDLSFLQYKYLKKSDILFSNLGYILLMPSLTSNINVNLNVDINQLNMADSSIKNITLNSYNILGNTLIEKMQFVLPGNSNFNMHGIIAHNDMKKKFNGVVDIDSEESKTLLQWYQGMNLNDVKEKNTMKASAFLIIMKDFFKVDNLNITSDKMNLNGDITIYDIPYEAPTKNLRIQAQGFDFDAMKFTDTFDSYLKNLYLADPDKTGEQYFKLTSTDKWIRCFDKHLHMDLDLDNTTIRGQKIKNIKAIINIKPSNLNIQSIKFDDEKINGDLNFNLFLPVMRPQVSGKINLQYLDWKFFQSMLPSYGYFYGENSKISQKINLFSANSYDGSLNIDIDKFKVNDEIILENINALLELQLGSLLMKKLNYKLWNGIFDLKAGAAISSNNPLLNLHFSVFNVNPKGLFKQITGIDKMDGYMSLAGDLKGNLIRFDDIKKINGQIAFEGAQVSWDGLGLNDVIKVTDSDYTKDSKLANVDYYMHYGKTVFDSLKGYMLFNKGIIKVDNASLTTHRLAGVYSMNYNLFVNEINGAGAFAFIPVNSKDTLMVKTKITGNLLKPQDNTVDYTEVTAFIKKAAVK